jgi:hypothetical protein
LTDINIIAGLFTFFANLGYLGIFVISFVGSIIAFVPIPEADDNIKRAGFIYKWALLSLYYRIDYDQHFVRHYLRLS